MEMTDNHTLEKNSFQYITLNKENIEVVLTFLTKV